MKNLHICSEDWHYVRVISSGLYIADNFDHTPHIHESKFFESLEEAEDFVENQISAQFRKDFIVLSQKENRIFDCIFDCIES